MVAPAEHREAAVREHANLTAKVSPINILTSPARAKAHLNQEAPSSTLSMLKKRRTLKVMVNL